MKHKYYFYIFILILQNNFNSTISSKINPKINSGNILLTGAAGFIGSNFLKHMFKKYPKQKYIVLDALTYAGNLNNIPEYIKKSDRFEFHHGSVTNVYLVDKLMQKVDYVVHFAAESHVTNSIYEDNAFFDTDVNGTRVMMRALVKYQDRVKRFIHISTSEVYGTAETEPMTEDHPLNPRSPYAAAKAGADRLVYSYGVTYDIPAVILRPFNNYGPRQHLEKVIPKFITQILSGEYITVEDSGLQSRDWVYVTDTCRAIDKALSIEDFDKIKNQVINIGIGKKISIKNIANSLVKNMNVPTDKIRFFKNRPGQVKTHISSTDKAKRLLNWEPKVKFDQGIKKVIKWYKSSKAQWPKGHRFLIGIIDF